MCACVCVCECVCARVVCARHGEKAKNTEPERTKADPVLPFPQLHRGSATMDSAIFSFAALTLQREEGKACQSVYATCACVCVCVRARARVCVRLIMVHSGSAREATATASLAVLSLHTGEGEAEEKKCARACARGCECSCCARVGENPVSTDFLGVQECAAPQASRIPWCKAVHSADNEAMSLNPYREGLVGQRFARGDSMMPPRAHGRTAIRAVISSPDIPKDLWSSVRALTSSVPRRRAVRTRSFTEKRKCSQTNVVGTASGLRTHQVSNVMGVASISNCGRDCGYWGRSLRTQIRATGKGKQLKRRRVRERH